MYHSIAPPGHAAGPWSLPLDEFRRQLDLLAGYGWKTVKPGEMGAGAESRRTVAITFDDGYSDNWAAYEELQKRGMCASWFIVSGSIGKMPDWRDDDMPPKPLLDKSQLREMAGAGMEIGSHTRHHLHLTGLDGTALQAEIAGSRDDLEQILGMHVNSFAYPYGEYDDRVRQAVHDAGYKLACTTRSGWSMLDSHPLAIRRLTIYGSDSLAVFARKLAFADNNAGLPRLMGYLASRALSHLTGKTR